MFIKLLQLRKNIGQFSKNLKYIFYTGAESGFSKIIVDEENKVIKADKTQEYASKTYEEMEKDTPVTHFAHTPLGSAWRGFLWGVRKSEVHICEFRTNIL